MLSIDSLVSWKKYRVSEYLTNHDCIILIVTFVFNHLVLVFIFIIYTHYKCSKVQKKKKKKFLPSVFQLFVSKEMTNKKLNIYKD